MPTLRSLSDLTHCHFAYIDDLYLSQAPFVELRLEGEMRHFRRCTVYGG
nr:G284 [uncultured bacterium]